MPSNNLALRYAREMEVHAHGTALYHPESLDNLHTGSCGYFDDLGKWQPIIRDINDKVTLRKLGFTFPSTLLRMPDRRHKWDLLTSNSTFCTKDAIGAGVSALPAGVPVGASIILDYQTSSDFGALLHCPEEVVEDGYFHHDVFSRWAKENAEQILQTQPEVKSKFVWVVTGVWATSDPGSMRGWGTKGM